MSSTPQLHGYSLSPVAHSAPVSEQGRKAESVANRAASSQNFRRSGEIQAGSAYSWAPPAPSPRGWTAPKIKTLKYDIYHGKDPALGGGTVAAARRRWKRFGAAAPPSEKADDSISPLKDRSNPQTPSKTPAKSSFFPATPESERRPQSEQRARATPAKEALTPRPPTAPAPTKVVMAGPLTSFEGVVKAAKAAADGVLVQAPPHRAPSCPNASVSVHTGNIMPSCWSPVPEPRPDEVDPARTFEHAGKVTGIRRPHTARPSYHREKPRRMPEDLNSVQSQMMYTGSAAFVPPRRNYLPPNEDEMKSKRRENRQKLIGKHILRRDLKKDETLVHYSYIYYKTKRIPKETNPAKGIGTVIGWDRDGLMTNVHWEDGSVEYCCTGFSGLYFLALVEVPEDKTKKEKEEVPSDINFDDIRNYPLFFVNEQGISRMASRPGAHRRTPRDIAQTKIWIQRLDKLLVDAQGNRKALLAKQLERAEADLASLLHDRKVMTAGIHCMVGDKEHFVRPSTLAPVGIVPKKKKISILEEVKRLVRREAEKERRRRREEEELEAERRRLERKILRRSQNVEDLESAHKVRLERKLMDPWTAIITANEHQLGHILQQTFTLFDVDQSGWIDTHEFEKAMDQMGLHGQGEILDALLSVTDVDKSGHIDFREFQHLALSLIEARKHVKEQEKAKQEKTRQAQRREAAGFSRSKSEESVEEPEIEQTMLEKAVAASSLLMKDVEGVDTHPQRKRRASVSSVQSSSHSESGGLSRAASAHAPAATSTPLLQHASIAPGRAASKNSTSSGSERPPSNVASTAHQRRHSVEDAVSKPKNSSRRRYSLTFGEMPDNLPYDSFAPLVKPPQKDTDGDDDEQSNKPEQKAAPETSQRRTLRTLGSSEQDLSKLKSGSSAPMAGNAARQSTPTAQLASTAGDQHHASSLASTPRTPASLVSMTTTPTQANAASSSPSDRPLATSTLQPTPPATTRPRPKSARQSPGNARRNVSWS